MANYVENANITRDLGTSINPNWLSGQPNVTSETNIDDDVDFANSLLDQQMKAKGMNDALNWLREKKKDADGILGDTKLQMDDFSDFLSLKEQDGSGMAAALDWLSGSSDKSIVGPSPPSKFKKEEETSKMEQEGRAKSMVDALDWLTKNNSVDEPIDIANFDDAMANYVENANIT